MHISQAAKKAILSFLKKRSRKLRGVIISGDINRIKIGKNTVIEDGAVLSTEHGGALNIGENCIIRRGAIVSTCGGDIKIGNNTVINHYDVIYGHGGLTIGDYVMFAAHCVIIPANHGYASLDHPMYKQALDKKGIVIGNDVWFGAGVTVMDGVNIGSGVIVGAGSVVTNDLPDFSVSYGVPARIRKFRGS